MTHKEIVEAHILGIERVLDYARIGKENRFGHVKNVVSLEWLERACAEDIARLRSQIQQVSPDQPDKPSS